VRPVFKFSVAFAALVLVTWLGFVAWSIYSMLPGSANDLPRDRSMPLPERSEGSASPEVSAPDPEPAELQVRHVEPAQLDPGPEPIASGAGRCNTSVSLRWPDPGDLVAEPMAMTTSPEVLEEQAMAGNAMAQWTIGFMVQQELMTTPTKDRSSFAPQRFEYMRNFLILAAQKGRRSAAHELAEAYIAAQRDVVEAAAWLRIADRISASYGPLVQDYERQGIIVLSNEQRAESLRVAAQLAATYKLPLPRNVVSDDPTSDPASDDCISSPSDPDLSAAAELDAYRVDWERNSFAPGIVPEAELQRRFRDLRTRLVTAAQRGDRSALPMLATLHRVSPTDEGAVAAAVWDRVGTRLDGTVDGDSPEPSAADTLPGLPLAPKPRYTDPDPRMQELRENFRRHGVRPGILAEQSIMILELD
jgi:hypothetical protein